MRKIVIPVLLGLLCYSCRPTKEMSRNDVNTVAGQDSLTNDVVNQKKSLPIDPMRNRINLAQQLIDDQDFLGTLSLIRFGKFYFCKVKAAEFRAYAIEVDKEAELYFRLSGINRQSALRRFFKSKKTKEQEEKKLENFLKSYDDQLKQVERGKQNARIALGQFIKNFQDER